MKLHRKIKLAVLGVAVFSAASASSAVTLGRAHGAVLLGQPLKLAVPIHSEPGDGLTAQCLSAEVFYGDIKQDASQVSVTRDVTSPSQSAHVYVGAVATVDEPVVTVYLYSGCANRTSRRYVLLTDLATAPTPRPIEASTSLPRLPSGSQSKARVAPSVATTTGRPRQAKGLRLDEIDAPSRQAPSVKSQFNNQAATTSRPRLKLAPMEPLVDRDPALMLSSEMLFGGSGDGKRRMEAVALWQSLNATPQEVLSAQSRQQAIEGDLKGLHEVTSKNREILNDLSRRLVAAETERYSNALVHGLMAILLAFCLALIYTWYRAHRGDLGVSPWWGAQALGEDDGDAERDQNVASGNVDGAPTRFTPQVVSLVERESVESAPASTTIEIDFDLSASTAVDENEKQTALEIRHVAAVAMATSRANGHQDFAESMTASLRAVSTNEMLDIRQQADFFMTLGQHREAVEVLVQSIDTSADSNPLVYLDLLKVLHTLGRKAEYDVYRNAFNAIFSGRIPQYTDFNQGGRGLETYSDVCRRIVQYWPGNEAVAYIEDCLVNHLDTGSPLEFDLEAYRDLLMLHGVARRVVSSIESGFTPFSAARMEPIALGSRSISAADPSGALAFNDQNDPARVDLQAGGVTVDFDLTEPPGNLIEFDATDLHYKKGSN